MEYTQLLLVDILQFRDILHTHTHTHTHSLISTMLVVDPNRRASLDKVAVHLWFNEGKEDEVDSQLNYPTLPTISSIEEMPVEDVEIILNRMDQGGYGSQEDILQ